MTPVSGSSSARSWMGYVAPRISCAATGTLADDVVSDAVVKIFRNWRRISRMENLDAYVRRAVVNAWLDERRRPWRRERSVAELPPVAQPAGDRSR